MSVWQSSARPVRPFGWHQTVTTSGAKQTKTAQNPKTEIVLPYGWRRDL